MPDFSPTDAGLAGFRLTRENPRTVVVWAVLMLVTNLLTLVILASMAAPAMMELQAASGSAEPDFDRMMAAWRQLAPAYLVTMVVSVVATGILNASAARMVLTPGREGLIGNLAFGADEVRQIILVIIMNLIFLGVAMLAGFFVGILAAVGGIAAGVLGTFLAILAAIPVIIFLAIRLSLATALTYEAKRIALREAWRMTKGHFWNLFVAYLIAGIMAIIVWLLGLAIAMGVISVAFGFEGIGRATAPDMTSIATLLGAPVLVYHGLMAAFLALAYINVLTPGPTIYAQLKGRPDVFD